MFVRRSASTAFVRANPVRVPAVVDKQKAAVLKLHTYQLGGYDDDEDFEDVIGADFSPADIAVDVQQDQFAGFPSRAFREFLLGKPTGTRFGYDKGASVPYDPETFGLGIAPAVAGAAQIASGFFHSSGSGQRVQQANQMADAVASGNKSALMQLRARAVSFPNARDGFAPALAKLQSAGILDASNNMLIPGWYEYVAGASELFDTPTSRWSTTPPPGWAPMGPGAAPPSMPPIGIMAPGGGVQPQPAPPGAIFPGPPNIPHLPPIPAVDMTIPGTGITIPAPPGTVTDASARPGKETKFRQAGLFSGATMPVVLLIGGGLLLIAQMGGGRGRSQRARKRR